MPEAAPTNESSNEAPPSAGPNQRAPFPLSRLLYSLLFGLIAYFAFWIVVLLGAIQFINVLLNGKVNEELRRVTLSVIQYLWELLAFMTFVRDEQPFPLGPFPSYAESKT